MNWLITGGCGFIGTNLVDALTRQEGQRVRVLDDLTVGTRDALAAVAPVAEGPGWSEPGTVSLHVGDVRHPSTCDAAADGADAIVHLAGNTGVQPSLADPVADCSANVLGTLHLLEAARSHEVGRFVFASSGGTVIGDGVPPIDESMVPRPKSPYGASKSACEGYCSAYHHAFGIATVALRFGNVYGPRSGHKNSVVARFLRQGMAGEPLVVFGDGDQSRDFIHVDDIVSAIRAAATAEGVGGEVFQIATSRETTVNEIAQAITRALTSAGYGPVDVRHGAALRGEIRRNFSNTEKARTRLGWTARIPLDEGLAQTLSWFTAQRDG